MTILCNIKNLNLTFGQKVIFEDAELTINQGDRIGLIGLNGQGKSTLFKVLTGEVEPNHSTPPFTYDKSNTKFEIFLVPQELNIEDYGHLSIQNYFLAFYPELHRIHGDLLTIEEKLAEASEYDELLRKQEKLLGQFQELGGWELQNAYTNYLKAFGLEDHERSITGLSGGEKRKMALSIGLSSPAEMILWDEPTNHLDIDTIERFEEELLVCKKTYLIITHDRYLLNHTTDKIFHIERGKINIFHGTYLDYLEHLEEKQKELAKNLDKLQNKHRRELAWMRQGIKARGTRSKKRVESFHNIRKEIDSLKGETKRVVDLNLYHSGRKSKILLELNKGSFHYPDKDIFDCLDLIVAKKDKIALIGPNGAGKTTLINIFQGKLELSSGVLKRAHELKVITFDQNRESLDEQKTPKEVIGEGTDFVELANGQKKHVHSYLENFLFTSDQVNRPIATLSGGEKKRLQLAMFMKQSADLWIFDEPTNDLDIETIELLESELKSYEAAVIIIGHDRAFLDNVCSTTWLVHEKNVEVFEGGYSQVAPYLQALELDKKLRQETAAKKVEKKEENKQSAKPKGLTYKEKQRFEVIEDEISQAEQTLEKLDEDLAAFDFSTMDESRQKEYNELLIKKEQQEVLVESLYEEWERLSSLV